MTVHSSSHLHYSPRIHKPCLGLPPSFRGRAGTHHQPPFELRGGALFREMTAKGAWTRGACLCPACPSGSVLDVTVLSCDERLWGLPGFTSWCVCDRAPFIMVSGPHCH